MDLWAWVNATEARLREQGHARLADLLDQIPSETCDDRHERVDALVSEALALAEAIDEPWLELFVRHWGLQSRILHRMDGAALGEAVSLVEFAHRDETRGCPQAVCAVQDLAAAYGFVDGPGYAPERLEVAREAEGRIDPTWSCFTCIATEYAAALRDQGDHAASLAFVEQKVAMLDAEGVPHAAHALSRARIDALLGLGRHQEALAFVAEDEKHGRDDAHHRLWRRLDRARLHVRLGDVAAARLALPTADEVRPTPLYYAAWVDAVAELVRAGAIPNDARLGATLQGFLERLERQGIGRMTLELAQIHGSLALGRGAVHIARRALAAMERAATLLHRPLDALDRIGQLRAALAAAPGLAEVVVPETAALVLAALASDDAHDPEKDLLLLEAAHARFGDDARVALALAGCQNAGGFESDAIATLDAFHRKTGDGDVVLRLGSLLLARPEDLAAVVERHRRLATDDASRAFADWLLARAAHASGDWKACLGHVDAVLLARPDGIASRVMYADAARRLGDHAAALAKLDEVVAMTPEGGPPDWDRMLVATLLGDHARVRESAKRVGIDLEGEGDGEGPIDTRMGFCRIRFEDDDRDEWALRISPVTARIIDIAPPPRAQRYRDVVAFEAIPLNAPPRNDEERQRHYCVYPWVATLTKGSHRAYVIDGIHPGEDVVDQLMDAAKALDCGFRVLSGDGYEVAGVRGLYCAVALPEPADEAAVCAALQRVIGDRKLAFAALARAAGAADLAERHAALAEELAL